MARRIPEQKWKWFGNAGHLCVGSQCRFHLCTQIGRYLVSTVGQYFPSEAARAVFAQSRGITIRGRGDEAEYDYLQKFGYEDIGYGRKYETMVFIAGQPCTVTTCGCGMPAIDGTELDSEGYNDAGAAREGHMKMCERVATGKIARE